jgi:GNAT superfamily N-acetyltransferase
MSRMPMPASTEDLEPPGGAFVIGREDGRAVAGGGITRLGPGVAEIKRMYVVPVARRRGHARRLLAALEDAARELGYARVRLDTGARQPHARALYEAAGFQPIPDYNDNPKAAYWGEKVL